MDPTFVGHEAMRWPAQVYGRLGGVLLALVWPGLVQAAAQVEAELFIPPAETHVIGDPIPLYWRFKNVSTEPLAFMWEGCCRLNGRLTVTAVDKPVTMVPPGQALAHMFAKAERIEPGVPRDFDTFLSDWTRLNASGTYELRGRYTGVLPDQHPQVPRGLNLWRDAATTPPIQVRLTRVEDYLAQRADWIERRGLSPELSGPDALAPLEPATFRLHIRNTGSAEQVLQWPEAVDLWLIDAAGQRVRGAHTRVDDPYEEIRLAPGASQIRNIPIQPALLEGEPFGDYRVFVDLRPGPAGQPRVPSEARRLAWHVSSAQTVDLLNRASAGPGAGIRNAPLKFLRVYLTELRATLDALEESSVSPTAAPLLKQLQLASCLKSFAPQPGRVDLPVRLRADGGWDWSDPQLRPCLASPGRPLLEAFREVLAVRRHLGWEVGLLLELDPATRMATLASMARPIASMTSELAGAPRVRWATVGRAVTNHIQCPGTLPPANVVVKLATSGDGVVVTAARKLPDPQQPQRPEKFQPAEISGLALELVRDAAALGELVADARLRAPHAVILADPALTWEQVLLAIEPLSHRSLAIDLVVLP